MVDEAYVGDWAMLIAPGATTVVKKLAIFLSRSLFLVDKRWFVVDESCKNKLENPLERVNLSSFSPFTRCHGGGTRGGRGWIHGLACRSGMLHGMMIALLLLTHLLQLPQPLSSNLWFKQGYVFEE